jgi:phage terminase small subunit
MPVLENPREERFAQARAKGLCADAAYVAAGYKAHRGNASRMSANENVQARIAEIQARAEEKFTLSRIEWLEWFKRMFPPCVVAFVRSA